MPRLARKTRKEALLPLIEAGGSILFLPSLLGRSALRAKGFSGVERVLWVNVWGHGDTVLSTPALASLRQAFPCAKITLLVQPQTWPLVAQTPYVDEIITGRVPWSRPENKYKVRDYVKGEFPKLVQSLRERQFDLAIDGHMDARNNMFLWMIGARRRLGFDYGGGRFFLTDLVAPDFGHPHHADLMVQLAKHVGGKELLERPNVPVPEESRQAAKEFWAEHGLEGPHLVVGIHPGAGHQLRFWGLDRFASVADSLRKRFPVKFLCFCQPDGYGSEIPISSPHVIVSTSLNQFMALLEKCDLLLCNDGGPMHIATGVGTPVVAVFGPGEPKWWSPKGKNSEFVALGGFQCRPCFDRCKFDQPYCLTWLSVEQVLEVAERKVEHLLLSPHRRPPFRGDKPLQSGDV